MHRAVILDFVRTPIGRWAGVLAAVRPDDMAAHVIRKLLKRRENFDPSTIDEVFFGCANQAGEDNRDVARMAALLAGLPPSVPGVTLNRLCASGLDAVGAAARAIMSGEIQMAIAGGVESMSRAPFVMGKAEHSYQRKARLEDTTIGWRFVNPVMERLYGVDSMPQTAENVAQQFAISRADQDAFAYASQQRARAAREAGWFSAEIAPMDVRDKFNQPSQVTEDEHPRPQTTYDQLSALKPVVGIGGTVTAGNSSGVNDGAAALLIANEQTAERLGISPIARILAMASAGVEPKIMGIGPVSAVAKLCDRLAIKPGDFDIVELNEAFASQSLACLRQLGLSDDSPHVNPHGGAIALGHPLGMSGARLAGTAARALAANGGRLALVTMCVGVGQGVALALERAN